MKNKRVIVHSKPLFIITMIVLVIVIVLIWLTGLKSHKTIIENSYLSTSVLGISFFLFVSIGLYKGVRLKENFGKVVIGAPSDNSNVPVDEVRITKDFVKDTPFQKVTSSIDFSDGIDGEDLVGGLFSIIAWVIVSVFITSVIWLFGAIFWPIILVLIAMLYWVFYRAYKYVFRNSIICKGNLMKSTLYGLGYTLVYISWIYGIIYFVDLIRY